MNVHVNVNAPQKTKTVVVHARLNQKLYGHLKKRSAVEFCTISMLIMRLVLNDMGQAVRDGK